MSRVAAIALLAAGSGLLFASASRDRAGIEAGEGAGIDLPTFSLDNITDRVETLMNQVTEQPADVPQDQADANVTAGLQTIQHAEGTIGQPDPYRVCYGYAHTIRDLSEHPVITGEWPGEVLPDAMCSAAGFGPGCKSTAAGAYQINRPTWVRARDALGLTDFSQASQDAAAQWLIAKRGALEDLKAGRFAEFVSKCRNEWASLPGNYAKQGQRSLEQLAAWFTVAGGNLA
jgi:muramidase (phage lysozyme)